MSELIFVFTLREQFSQVQNTIVNLERSISAVVYCEL